MDSLRNISKKSNVFSKESIKRLEGFTISIIHFVLVLGIYTVTVFSFDMKTLVCTSFIALSILLINIILHDCPLSQMEEQRIGDSFVDFLARHFPINYDRTKRYEMQLQYIFTALAIMASKIIYLLLKNDLKNILL